MPHPPPRAFPLRARRVSTIMVGMTHLGHAAVPRPSTTLNRRRFLAGTLGASAALALPGAGRRVLGANDRIRIGFIGVGGRGMSSVKWFSALPGVEVAWLCDADREAVEKAAKAYPDARTCADMRKVLDDKSVDATVISTCNHWHALAGIWSCQAGKDVYVEKPIAHNVWEGRKLVEAARKYRRIVQGGTQQRSDPLQAELKAFLKSGAIGRIKYVRCNRYGKRESIGKRTSPLPPPETLNYDLWLGPAQDLPILREKLHYDWHWVWNTGNGEMGNWCPHILDDVRNVVFEDACTLPRRVLAGGGRFVWNDAGETPNTHFAYFDTGTIPVLIDVHNLPADPSGKREDVYRKRRSRGFLIIECENGYYAGGRGGGAFFDPAGKQIKRVTGDSGGQHAANFLAAMRSRNPGDLNADIEQAHYSSAWCFLANISWRIGRKYSRGEALERLRGLQPWAELLGEFHEHVAANSIDLNQADARLGALLEIDPKRETFTGPAATPDALALLRREYRAQYTVPDTV